MLTFTIPTFNRAERLDILLSKLVAEIEKHGKNKVKVFVHDDASSDTTKHVIGNWTHLYPQIVSAVRSDENLGQWYTLGNFYSLQKAIYGSETEWTWMLGDDDMLNEGVLPLVLSIIENTDLQYIHVAEDTRCAGHNVLYTMPYEDLCNSVGMIEMSSFISSTLMRTELLKRVYSNEMGERYKDCGTFGYCAAFYDVLHGQKAAYFDYPCVTLQDKEQTKESLERWHKGEVVRNFGKLADGLDILVAQGKLTKTVPHIFLRYLTSDIIAKVANSFISVTLNGETVGEDEWQRLERMADYFEQDVAEERKAYVRNYRQAVETLAVTVKAMCEKLDTANEVFLSGCDEKYPFTYIN